MCKNILVYNFWMKTFQICSSIVDWCTHEYTMFYEKESFPTVHSIEIQEVSVNCIARIEYRIVDHGTGANPEKFKGSFDN